MKKSWIYSGVYCTFPSKNPTFMAIYTGFSFFLCMHNGHKVRAKVLLSTYVFANVPRLTKYPHFCQWTNVHISVCCLSVQMYGTVHFPTVLGIRIIIESRGRILWRNENKSPPCYSQTPLLKDLPSPPWENWFVM